MGGILRTLGSLAASAVGLAMMVAGATVFVMIVFFTETFITLMLTVMPFLQWLVGFGFLVSVALGLPFLIFQRTRPASMVIFTSTAWVLGAATWIFSVVLVYSLWGKFATIIGIMLLPAIVPMAVIATLLGGEWMPLGSLVLALVIWFVLLGGVALAARLSDRHQVRTFSAS